MIDFIINYGQLIFGVIFLLCIIIYFGKVGGPAYCMRQIIVFKAVAIIIPLFVITSLLIIAYERWAAGENLEEWYQKLIFGPFAMLPVFILVIYCIVMLVMHLILNMSLYQPINNETVLNESQFAKLEKCIKRWGWYHRLICRFRDVGIEEILLKHKDRLC